MAWRACLLFSTVLALPAVGAVNHTLVLLSDFKDARCLDGSPGAFYWRPALASSGSGKFAIFLEGGGLCAHNSSCTGRSHTGLGSSTSYPKTANVEAEGSVLSSNATENPYWDYNSVFVKYCSGDMWAGQRQGAPGDDTYGLYFAGSLIVRGLIEHLAANAGIEKASTVVFGGGSAGGIGTFYNLRHVEQRLAPSGVPVLGFPVGGFPPQIVNYAGKNAETPEENVTTAGFASHRTLYNATIDPVCGAFYGEADAYKCMVPTLLYPHLKTPIFIAESVFDSVVSCGFAGLPCDKILFTLTSKDVKAWLESYGANLTQNVQQQVVPKAGDGAFIPACFMHTGFTAFHPKIGGVDALSASFAWVQSRLNETAAADQIQNAHLYVEKPCSHPLVPQCNPTCPPFLPKNMQ